MCSSLLFLSAGWIKHASVFTLLCVFWIIETNLMSAKATCWHLLWISRWCVSDTHINLSTLLAQEEVTYSFSHQHPVSLLNPTRWAEDFGVNMSSSNQRLFSLEPFYTLADGYHVTLVQLCSCAMQMSITVVYWTRGNQAVLSSFQLPFTWVVSVTSS